MLATMVVLLPASVARAQDPPADPPPEATPAESGFAVQPSGPDGPGSRDWFTYTLDPGAVFGDTVAISNLGDRPIRFVIFPTDAVSVVDVGGFAALKDDETPVDVGTWIELAAGEYTVPPGQRIDVPFSITVPDDAEPGDHAGAILAVDADEGSFDPSIAPDGISFNVRHRMGARVYVRVSGPVEPALRIDELAVERDGGTATITWEVANTGNLRLAPSAQVRVTGLFGRTIRTVPVQQLPELLPGANYVGASIVTGLPSVEPLTAQLVLTAEGVRTEGSKQFAPYPWLLIAALLVLLLAATWWYRRRRRSQRNQGSPPSRSNDRVPVPA
ncbi:MAG: WxL protein peptidoglycan domain-containing protein [Microthrixaceae bacterium]